MSRKHDCIVNGTDVLQQFKKEIGRTEKLAIELDGTSHSHSWWIEKGAPVQKDWYPTKGKCEWRYEIDGLWSSRCISFTSSLLVIITLTVLIGVFLIAVIVFTIIVLKHRNATRQKLEQSLIADPTSVFPVSFYSIYTWRFNIPQLIQGGWSHSYTNRMPLTTLFKYPCSLHKDSSRGYSCQIPIIHFSNSHAIKQSVLRRFCSATSHCPLQYH